MHHHAYYLAVGHCDECGSMEILPILPGGNTKYAGLSHQGLDELEKAVYDTKTVDGARQRYCVESEQKHTGLADVVCPSAKVFGRWYGSNPSSLFGNDLIPPAS